MLVVLQAVPVRGPTGGCCGQRGAQTGERTVMAHPPFLPRSAATPDYSGFLRRQLGQQAGNVASYALDGEQVWLKKAGPRNGMWGYRVLGALARATRLPVLRPVPNLGGEAAIATEAQRLRDLASRGLRVPEVLAQQPGGLLLAPLGRAGQPTPSLGKEIEHALPAGPQAVLALWQEGLHALGYVHATGTSLSQAFARNLVRCPDGTVGYIDFEDDPAAVLPLAHCQARDALCFVHSTALFLVQAGALAQAQAAWQQWLAGCSPGVRRTLVDTSARLGWLRHLPASRSLGRDLQRARAAHDVLAGQPPMAAPAAPALPPSRPG